MDVVRSGWWSLICRADGSEVLVTLVVTKSIGGAARSWGALSAGRRMGGYARWGGGRSRPTVVFTGGSVGGRATVAFAGIGLVPMMGGSARFGVLVGRGALLRG